MPDTSSGVRAAAGGGLRTPHRAVAAMFLLNGGLFGAWASRIPSVQAAFGFTAGELGLLLLGLAGGAIASFPLAGALSDRFGAAAVTRATALLYAPALPLIALSSGVPALAGALMLFGAAHGAMDVAMNGWGAEVERRRGRPVMSGFHAMFSIGAGLGAGSGVLAAALGLGIAAHFAAFAALSAIPLLWFAALPWRGDRAGPASPKSVFALPRGTLLLVGVVAFCASLGEGAMADWSAVFLVSVASASEGEAALGYMVFSVAMVTMRLLGDRVTQALGSVAAARLSGALATTGVLLASLGGGAATALCGFFLMGLGYALVMPLVFSRAANDRNVKPGTAIASVATLGYGGMLLGPPVIGFVADLTSLQTSFGLLAVLAFTILAAAPGFAVTTAGKRR